MAAYYSLMTKQNIYGRVGVFQGYGTYSICCTHDNVLCKVRKTFRTQVVSVASYAFRHFLSRHHQWHKYVVVLVLRFCALLIWCQCLYAQFGRRDETQRTDTNNESTPYMSKILRKCSLFKTLMMRPAKKSKHVARDGKY